MVNIDALYRRARRSVVAPDWVKPYLDVRPSEARRMLRGDFRNGALNFEEEAAVRYFIEELAEAERTESEYPTWNQAIEALIRREEMTDEEWFEGVRNGGFPEKYSDSKKDSE